MTRKKEPETAPTEETQSGETQRGPKSTNYHCVQGRSEGGKFVTLVELRNAVDAATVMELLKTHQADDYSDYRRIKINVPYGDEG